MSFAPPPRDSHHFAGNVTVSHGGKAQESKEEIALKAQHAASYRADVAKIIEVLDDEWRTAVQLARLAHVTLPKMVTALRSVGGIQIRVEGGAKRLEYRRG